MRITNHMISSSSLRNMQKSMNTSANLTEQLTTGKKIQRPSEDPVIAIRALKLRTTVNQLEQYKNKNIKDANSWLDTTETSITNVVNRLQDVYSYCTQGATDSFNTENRSAIVDDLKSLKEMINAEGSTTYAGRYIFSGYKTDTSLTFDTELSTNNISYDIEENLKYTDIGVKNVVFNQVDASSLDGILAGTSTYNSPTEGTVYSLKLAYDDLQCDNTVSPVTANIDVSIDGVSAATNYNFKIKGADEAGTYNEIGDNDIVYVPETGELLFGKDAYTGIKSAQDIKVSYTKSDFDVGDLRPEHYFNCTKHETKKDGTIDDTTYTQSDKGQEIQYEVNFNQKITVNTEGKDVITHSMGNNIDNMAEAVQEVIDIEDTIAKLKDMLEDPQYSANDAAKTQISKMIEDADIELALKRSNMQKIFGENMTTFTNYMDDVTAVQSKSGTRVDKLNLISSRVTAQYTNFKNLMSSNEDVETEEAIIDFNESELVYNSALAATGSVIQKTLLDYL